MPVKLPSGTVITAISAGQVHALAVTRSGAALAWGFGDAPAMGPA